MGVLGLTPFLQKTCPRILQALPNRFCDLKGKKLVLDGTLLTQRLHFAPMPNPYRHVLGWYRMIKELRDSDVTAICIFDGTQRNLAKQLELERRRRNRQLTLARGTFENDRLQRLQKLNMLLSSWQSLDDSTRLMAVDVLGSLVSKTAHAIPPSSYLAGGLEYPHDIDALLDRDDLLVPSTQDEAYGAFENDDIYEVLKKRTDMPVSAPQDLYVEPIDVSEASANLQDFIFEDRSATRLPNELPPHYEPSPETEPEILARATQDYVVSTLTSLYTDYRQSIPQLASLASATPPLTAAASLVSSEEESAEIKEEYAMSKTQNQLTAEEGLFWEKLAEPAAAVSSSETIHASIISLAEKSELMSESYDRRSHPPTTEVYQQCKEIIRAMGVPCIETDGPYEAEALASSMVLNGLADYVGSEDTDVLVYEASMVRNMTSRDGPLTIVSGRDAREELQLDRPGYIDFALLLGTDFSRRIKNVGPHRALKFIQKHGSIERILQEERQYPPRIPIPMYLEQVSLARSVYESLPPVPDSSAMTEGKYDQDEVLDILRKYGLHWAAVEDWDYQAALAGNYFADNPASF